jgi:ABC-type sugar transport system ATPase subunit
MMLECRAITIESGDFLLEGLDLRIEKGQWASIMGPTGCGKTTLLEAVCGLREVCSGSIWIDGQVVTNWSPRHRGIGLVPQDGAIFNGMRVQSMLALPLRARGIRRKERRVKVAAMADRLGIGALLRRTASGLSGGERQRIALGRALIHRPGLLCLDEPLMALDSSTRSSIQDLLKAVRDESDVTVLHVTHDAAEARTLSHTILEMRDGKLKEVDDDHR